MVDNASSDGSDAITEAAAERNESVRLLRSPTNRGYAGAVNLALAEARGDYVAVLNMDVVISPGWLDPLVSFLEASPEAGARFFAASVAALSAFIADFRHWPIPRPQA